MRSPILKSKKRVIIMPSNEFKNLLWSDEDLQAALKSNPNLMKEQDEEGMTLLHHAAQIGFIMGSLNARKVLEALFKAPEIDFSIKDKNENTALHVAAYCSQERVTCQYIFPTLVKEAADHGFDFSTLGQNGQSILHIATRTSYTDPRGVFGRKNNVKNVLDNARDPGLNTLSSSGSTAFYYAVNHCYIDEAKTLLDAGADPLLYGAKDRDPLAMVDEHLKVFSEALTQCEYADGHKDIKILIGSLNELKEKMKYKLLEKDSTSILTCAPHNIKAKIDLLKDFDLPVAYYLLGTIYNHPEFDIYDPDKAFEYFQNANNYLPAHKALLPFLIASCVEEEKIVDPIAFAAAQQIATDILVKDPYHQEAKIFLDSAKKYEGSVKIAGEFQRIVGRPMKSMTFFKGITKAMHQTVLFERKNSRNEQDAEDRAAAQHEFDMNWGLTLTIR